MATDLGGARVRAPFPDAMACAAVAAAAAFPCQHAQDDVMNHPAAARRSRIRGVHLKG
ncbi:MAG: hypothetical protein ACHP83_13795 [Burkholderiales bacterium]